MIMRHVEIYGMLAMLLAVGFAGCIGTAVTPAVVTELSGGWSLDADNSGSINISGVFNAYMNTYEHHYEAIPDGLIFLAKMSDISIIDEVGSLNGLIDENLDGVVQKLESELNCQIIVEKHGGEIVEIDGYNVTEYSYTLSGSSSDGTISGNVVRAVWNCTDNSVVAVLGFTISSYKERGAAAITPSPYQWENIKEMLLSIDC